MQHGALWLAGHELIYRTCSPHCHSNCGRLLRLRPGVPVRTVCPLTMSTDKKRISCMHTHTHTLLLGDALLSLSSCRATKCLCAIWSLRRKRAFRSRFYFNDKTVQILILIKDLHLLMISPYTAEQLPAHYTIQASNNKSRMGIYSKNNAIPMSPLHTHASTHSSMCVCIHPIV